VAISDYRIVKAEDGKVTFKYRKPESRRMRTMTLSAMEFIRRFLQYTLPSGLMKVRYYGFMHACSGVSADKVRAAVELMQGFDVSDPALKGRHRDMHGASMPEMRRRTDLPVFCFAA